MLARLHVESLASAAALSTKHVRRKLQTLPTTLVGTYDDAMRRIEAQEPDHRDIAVKTLAWVSYAFRSLSVQELQHALVIEPGHSELDEELLLDAQSITALCAGLVVVEPETNVVNLVHYTAKNYFENIRSVRFPGFHAAITMSCATYLALKELKGTSVWDIVRNFPLACYAAQYMGDHARQNPEEALEPSILQVICRLLSHPDKRKPLLSLLDGLDLIKSGFYSSFKHGVLSEDTDPSYLEEAGIIETVSPGEELVLPTVSIADESTNTALRSFHDDGYQADEGCTELRDAKIEVCQMPEVTALHLAASMGLAKVASMLLNEVPDIDAVDMTGKTALTVAMERGFEKAVEFLVNSGAFVDLSTEHGQGIFLLITESNWNKVAEIIALKARSAVCSDNTSHWQYPVRLLLAAYFGDNGEFERLVEQENIDLKGKDRQVAATALFLAVERNHQQMVQSLLDSGVDVGSKDSRGQTALHRATRRENEALMRILLTNRAEVDCKNDDGRTPWSANVRSRNGPLLAVLLEAGANPSIKGHQGVSELYDAATNGETNVVKFMLESGTDPSIKTQFRWAPLHWAAYYGHLDCVKLLVEAGAELSPVSDQDATPLDLAIRANQVAIVDLLTRAGALESRDVVISTPLTPKFDELRVDSWSASLPIQEKDTTLQMKLSLAFDKPLQQGLNVGQFVYPSMIKAPKDHIYHISHTLETPTGSLSIRQAERRADMVEYPLHPDIFRSDDALYEIVRITLDYQTLEIRPKNQSPLSGAIQMHRDWTGGWKIYHHHQGARDYLFRTTPDWSKMKEDGCHWMTEDGTLLARSGLEGVTPVFTSEHGSERQMQDILVTCWVAKLWSETVALQRLDVEIPRSKPLNE